MEKKKIIVLVIGLDGKMATEMANGIAKAPDMELMQVGLKGYRTDPFIVMINELPIKLYSPDKKDDLIYGMGEKHSDVAIIFSSTSAVRENVDFCAKLRVPFVIGTTLAPGDMEYICEKIAKAHINAFVATNFAKEVVDFQHTIRFMLEMFPSMFENCTPQITESHPKYKTDVSGTAQTMIPLFNRFGFKISLDQIIKRRTDEDYAALGIPPEYWASHSYHEYAFMKKSGVQFKFSHIVLGRKAYVENALKAIRLLYKKRGDDEPGFTYGMENLDE